MSARSEQGGIQVSRRELLGSVGAAAMGLALGPLVGATHLAARERRALRIGIIGAGRIGGAVGIEWAVAGYDVIFSSRHPEELEPLVEQGGAATVAVLPNQAAVLGDIIFIAVPFDALPDVGREQGPFMQGKVVIVASNPARQNGGAASQAALARGTGVVLAECLPGVRLTRAFNAITYRSVTSEARRRGEKVGIPIVGDDAEAIRATSDLVTDAGFDPVFVGPLTEADRFDPGTPVFVSDMTAAQLREALGLR